MGILISKKVLEQLTLDTSRIACLESTFDLSPKGAGLNKMAEELQRVNNAIKRKFSSKKLIFGKGFIGAKIVFVGETPTIKEENAGKLMSAESEKILNKLLRTAGIDKKKVYFTNVVKYAPELLRGYSPKEVKSSVPFLKEELKTIKPEIVVTLGNVALNGIGFRQPLINIHGRPFNLGTYELFPTYHPEHTLKDPTLHSVLESDFTKLKELIKIRKDSPREEA